MRYSFFVGSTDTHDAHESIDSIVMQAALLPTVLHDAGKVFGVWEGQTERVAQYDVELSSDAVAQRIAYALSILTGNDCVLVIRDVEEREEHPAFNSIRRYRTFRETRYSGNRTLHTPPPHYITDPAGWVLTPSVTGGTVAYLVWQDASVTPVVEG